eukprot:6625105-Pyramimonas_sp.AAC.1
MDQSDAGSAGIFSRRTNRVRTHSLRHRPQLPEQGEVVGHQLQVHDWPVAVQRLRHVARPVRLDPRHSSHAANWHRQRGPTKRLMRPGLNQCYTVK